jgi:F0F1-type ATP synthase membrane subunit c/vacuolar-type H+-ATPase subunit K
MQVEDLEGWGLLRSHRFQLSVVLLVTGCCRKYAQNREISPEYHIFKVSLTGLDVLVAHLYISLVGLGMGDGVVGGALVSRASQHPNTSRTRISIHTLTTAETPGFIYPNHNLIEKPLNPRQ